MGGGFFGLALGAVSLVGTGSAIALQGGLQRAREAWPSVEEALLVPSPAAARVLSLGYRELAADLMWTRTLVYYGEGLSERQSLAFVAPLVEVVTGLDPHFKRAYRWGSFATTYKSGPATQEEFWASIRILERGVAQYPDDHELLWLLGLRYAYDVVGKDEAETRRYHELGASYMERAMRAPGAPARLALSAVAMRTRLGQTERALASLKEMILNTSDPAARASLEARYRELADGARATALAEEAAAFDARWKAALPFGPPSLYVLLGERPGPLPRLADLAAPPSVEVDE